MVRRYKDQPIILPADIARDKANKAIAASKARHRAHTDRYATATLAALAQAKANPNYQIIVEYLAECSTRIALIEHIVLDTLITEVLERGCTLTPVQIRSFLERDLKTMILVHQGTTMVRTPHGWTRERGSYPLDADAIWESWVWYPPADSEWA